MLKLPLWITPSADLLEPALELALRTDRTVHAGMYLALTVRLDGVMVSGDQRLVNALSEGPLSWHLRWIGDGL